MTTHKVWPRHIVQEVRDLKQQGLTYREITEHTGVPLSTAWAWVKRDANQTKTPKRPYAADDQEAPSTPEGGTEHVAGSED